MSKFVFLGPSLNLDIAKIILPDAQYLPPIACGNIIQVMALGAKTIVIIDGYFENQPSVWHKEILYALDKGIIVYGAASMGALRAAELSDFGMIGMGEVYHQYKRGDITDDDEVALLHFSEAENFLPCSLPMINIRFTIKFALQLRVITLEFATEFLSIAKQVFYQERTETILRAKCHHLEGIDLFFDWFRNNYIDQKMLDAQNLLIHLQLNENTPKVLRLNDYSFSYTALFRNLKIESLSTPLAFCYPLLPLAQKINGLARLFDEYSITQQLAKAIGVAHDSGFVKIEGTIVSFVHVLPNVKIVETIFDYFLKLSTLSLTNDIGKTSLRLLAEIVAHIYYYMSKFFELTALNSTTELTRYFYQKNNINSKKDFIKWLQKNDMKINEFKTAISLIDFFDYFIIKNNLSTIMKPQNINCIDYFSIAVSLNKLDSKIMKTLNLNKNKLLKDNMHNLTLNGDKYAISRDFIDSSNMRDFINKVASFDIDWLKASLLMSWKLQ